MLPNLRLVLATVFSTATLAFFFVSFASFRIAQEGLDRLPSSRVPAIQQLGFEADEKWSQHDSLNGAVPEIFHSLPAAFLNPARDAGAQIPEITVIDVPAAPQPETSLAADTEADVSVQTAVPVAAAETPAPETPAAQPSQEPAPMPVVIANETHTSEAFVAPPAAVATPIPRPAPTLASKTGEKPAGKKNVRAAAKSTPRAIAKRAAKTSALPRRKLALRQAPKPAPRAAAAATNPASARPAAKSTSSTAAPNPFSSLFQ